MMEGNFELTIDNGQLTIISIVDSLQLTVDSSAVWKAGSVCSYGVKNGRF